VPLYAYETEAEALEIDQRDTVTPRIIPLWCPSWRYTDEIVDFAFGVLPISSFIPEVVAVSLPISCLDGGIPHFEAKH
jgi:hypothetical protein